MDRALNGAKNCLVADIRRLESLEWGRDVRLMVRTNPNEDLAFYEGLPAHKLILCARSAVFRAMFTGEFADALKEEIFIEDCTPAAMKSLISFAYSGSVTFASVSHCIEVHTVADKYAFIDLMNLCEAYMLQQIQGSGVTMKKDDFIFILGCAETKCLPVLEKACLALLVEKGNVLMQRWSYPSFLTHKQALRVIIYGLECDDEVPSLISHSDDESLCNNCRAKLA